MDNNRSGGWWGRAIAGGVLKWMGFQVAALAGPAVLGVLATAAGRMSESAPWMWALAAGALTFGGAAAGVHFTLSVVDRYAVRGRLALATPRVAVDMASGDVALGVNLQSLADVAIEFEIREIRTQIDWAYPTSKPFERTIYEIPPRGHGFFSDHVIQFERSTVSGGKVSHGSVIAAVAYGRPGSRKHTLNVQCGVHIRFTNIGTIDGTSWEMLA